MGRRISFAQTNPAAEAGARSLDNLEGDISRERLFRYQVNRQEAQDARQAERDRTNDARYDAQVNRQDAQDQRAATRDKRIEESSTLEDQARKYHLEKERSLDENALKMKIEMDKHAKEANEELFKINTADENAQEKLADWGAKYFRVLDEKTGDPRLIKQFQINQGRVENRQVMKARADELRTAREAKEAANLGTITTRTKGGETTTSTTRPLKPGEEEAKAAHADLVSQHDAVVKAIGDKGWTPDNAEKVRLANALKVKLGYVPVDVPGVTNAAPASVVPANSAPAPASVPENAAAHLRQNPNLTAEFDAKYGTGASARILGK